MIIEIENDIIKISGKLDRNYWPAAQAAASMMVGQGYNNIIVDCEGVSEITEKGLDTFAQAFKYMSKRDVRIYFAHVDEKIEKLAMKTPGIRSSMPIAESVEEARASIFIDKQKGRKFREKELIFPVMGNLAHSSLFFDEYLRKNVPFTFVYPIIVPRKYNLYHPSKSLENKANADLCRAEGYSLFFNRQSKKNIVRSRNFKSYFARVAERFPNSPVFLSFAGVNMEKPENREKFTYFLENQKLQGVAVTEPFEENDWTQTKEFEHMLVCISNKDKEKDSCVDFAKKISKGKIPTDFVKPVKLRLNDTPFPAKDYIENFEQKDMRDCVCKTVSVRTRRHFLRDYIKNNNIDIMILSASWENEDLLTSLFLDPPCFICIVTDKFVL